MEKLRSKKQQSQILETITELAGALVSNWIITELRRISVDAKKPMVYPLADSVYAVGLDIIKQRGEYWQVTDINRDTKAWTPDMVTALVYSVARQTGRLGMARNIQLLSDEVIRLSSDREILTRNIADSQKRAIARAKLTEVQTNLCLASERLRKIIKNAKYIQTTTGLQNHAT